eukprot:TCONS_00048345-protein
MLNSKMGRQLTFICLFAIFLASFGEYVLGEEISCEKCKHLAQKYRNCITSNYDGREFPTELMALIEKPWKCDPNTKVRLNCKVQCQDFLKCYSNLNEKCSYANESGTPTLSPKVEYCKTSSIKKCEETMPENSTIEKFSLCVVMGHIRFCLQKKAHQRTAGSFCEDVYQKAEVCFGGSCIDIEFPVTVCT